MTLEQAIKHANDVARRNEQKALEQFPNPNSTSHRVCMKCAEEHRQLAEWLTELRNRRKKDGSEVN